MKIAFVANTCWNIYNFRKGLVHHFLSKGHEVLVYAPKDEYSDKIKSWGIKWIDTPLEGTGTNPVKDLKYFKKLYAGFKSERPDIALSYTIKSNIYASVVCKLCGIPVLCNVSGLGTVFLVKGFAGKVALSLYRLAFRFSNHIFFQNPDDRKLFASYVKVNDTKTSILPGSGIDLKQFMPEPMRDSEQTNFVMIARVIIEKGVREFAEAASYFEKNENVNFTLIGKFDENHARTVSKEELDTWIESGWIKYLDHSDEIKRVIADHDVVVLPSYREGTSRTLLEGAAMGRPLIATDVPGCREVVKDGYNGFLCEVKNPKMLLDKIKLFLSLNLEEKKLLATNSRRLVEETYDEKFVIGLYEEVIRRNIDQTQNI